MSACQPEADWAWYFRCNIFGVAFQVGQMMKKRSLSIKGHMTSISLEDAFWAELGRIAGERGVYEAPRTSAAAPPARTPSEPKTTTTIATTKKQVGKKTTSKKKPIK